MKIAYLIASRGNPQRCAAAIEIARTMASGQHQITYYIGADRDDKDTVNYFWQKGPRDIVLSVEDRSPALGSIWNRLTRLAKDAEALCAMGDDVFVVTPDWDHSIADVMSKAALICAAWTDAGSPNQPTYPIISRGWYNLAGLYTDYFPFWFDDTYLAETWSFFSGQSMPILRNLVIASKKGKTKRMRDLAFWWRFFSSLRNLRMQKAARLREEIGMDPIPSAELALIRARWELRDQEAMLSFEDFERIMSANDEPTPEYILAKNRALTLMEKAA